MNRVFTWDANGTHTMGSNYPAGTLAVNYGKDEDTPKPIFKRPCGISTAYPVTFCNGAMQLAMILSIWSSCWAVRRFRFSWLRMVLLIWM